MAVDSLLLAEIQQAGARAYPNEACGFIIAKAKKSVLFECPNVSFKPRVHFMIDPHDYGKAADQGEIIGVWHTHVEESPKPSPADVSGCEASELPWVIVAVFKRDKVFTFSEPTTLEPVGFETPYIGRPYVSGPFDCYGLVRDYYRREYGVLLADFPRRLEDGRNANIMFVERYAELGFMRLINQEPKPGDLFLIQIVASISNHLAIYLGNDRILHHPLDRLSRVDVYGGGYWQKHTTHVLRHRSQL